MISPKVQRMQRSIRINEGQLLGLADKARYVHDPKLEKQNFKTLILLIRSQSSAKFDNFSLSSVFQPLWFVFVCSP